VQKRGARGTDARDIEEMLYLYRQASSDLARLRMMDGAPARIRSLNRLLSVAHSQIYQGRPRRKISLTRFFTHTYPRLFRQTWRYTVTSLLLCVTVYAMAYEIVQHHPEVIADILGGGDQEFTGIKTPEDITERFKQTASPVLSAAVTTNNINVALLAFSFGITFGIGTVYVLVVNSAMLGGIAGAFARSGVEDVLWSTILPHGALELTAIVFAGAAGMVMGWGLVSPGDRTRRRALREEASRAVQLALGLVPAFCVAGVFEGFITPSEVIPQWLKVALGVAVAVLFVAYLLFAGRLQDDDDADGPATKTPGWSSVTAASAA